MKPKQICLGFFIFCDHFQRNLFFLIIKYVSYKKLFVLYMKQSDKLTVLQNSKAPAAVRLVNILDYIAKKGHASFKDICENLSIPKSSTHHLLEVLTATQLLRQRSDGNFVLGLHLFELGGLAIRNFDIRQESIPFMHELVSLTGLTCHLGILDGTEGFFVGKIESPNAIVISSWEGKRIVFNRMALGKVLLAWQPLELVEKILEQCDFIYRTPKTITNKADFLVHLKQVRKQGWSIDDGEDIAEICCMAAPIFDPYGNVIAALGINGAQSQYVNGKKEEHLTHLVNISKKISKAISFGKQS